VEVRFVLGSELPSLRDRSGGLLTGGAIYKPEETDPEMLVYVGVSDIPKKLAKVKALGGEVVKEKTEIEGVGWYGLFKDLDGNLIGLFTGKPKE